MTFTAHDVRHLRVCEWCGGLGDDRYMLGTSPNAAHGRCFIAANGLPAFMALPSEETNKVTLGDIGMEAMKLLLAAREEKPI